MGAMQNNPQAKKRSKKRSNSRGDWGGFINCDMGKAEREGFKGFLKTNKIDLCDHIQELADAEINLSIAWSEKDDAYLAKATAVNEEDNKRYMLSAFHGDVETAFLLLFYKHHHLLNGLWWPDADVTSDEENWG